MNWARKASNALTQTVLRREFFLYAFSTAFVAWRLDLFEMEGTSLGVGPPWLQNIFEAAAVLVATFAGLVLLMALCCYPLVGLFPDVTDHSTGVRMERLFPYGFILSCVWVLLLG